jgi:eukaryotic-like serine/threonine-protein kinase
MDPAHWRRLETLCFAALERPAADRHVYLDDACAGDTLLRREVQSLLDQFERDPSFLERPLFHVRDLVAATGPGDETLPETIGPYRVIRRLGHGGMGEVYLALHEAGDVRQHVAVKVIRPGMNTAEVLERFRLERRILAGLNHPNIARFIGAGAAGDGRPYVALEYVEGRPIDAYCEALRLSIDERLKLFLVICGAVQHAHQNAVVHRDLKPGNILVADDGVPKLLDFGIGKVLGETEAFGTVLETRTHVRPLSPAYAAPEQVRSQTVTTATDVYALGVLLYELLAGHHPYLTSGATLHEIERSVLETHPLAPSATLSRLTPAARQLRRRLAGDLDTIVLKAMRKEPERRYASAAALADDIRRHLAGLPVSARPDTIAYRAGKFVRRNPGWVAAAVIAGIALGTTAAVTMVQSRRVALEAERVAHERDMATEVRSFLMEMFGAAAPDRATGDSVTVRQLLDLQAARVDAIYRDRPELRAEMLEVLADGYDRVGLYGPAEPLARQALELRRSLLGDGHPDVASSLNLLGWILHRTGSSQHAEPLLREAVAIRRAAGPRYQGDLSRSLNDLGVVLNALARYDDAGALLEEALDIRAAALGEDDRAVGITASNLAAAHYGRSRIDDAVEVQERAVRILSQSVGEDHQRSIVALGNLAVFRLVRGDWSAAVTDYRELLARQTRIQGPDHPLTAIIMGSLATALGYEAAATANDSGFAEAEALLRGALAVEEDRLGRSHPQVGATLDRLGNILLARGNVTEALAVQERAVAILRGAYGDEHSTTAAALGRLASIRERARVP